MLQTKKKVYISLLISLWQKKYIVFYCLNHCGVIELKLILLGPFHAVAKAIEKMFAMLHMSSIFFYPYPLSVAFGRDEKGGEEKEGEEMNNQSLHNKGLFLTFYVHPNSIFITHEPLHYTLFHTFYWTM